MTAVANPLARISMRDATVRFTEEMRGHVTFGETDFERGADATRLGSASIMFHLTIAVDDLPRFVADPGRRATARGYVRCDALGGRLPVVHGSFNLFVDDGPDAKRMRYRLLFRDGVGHPLTLVGHKLVRDDPGFDMWRDTTTLFTRLHAGHVDEDAEQDAEVVASGIVRIRPLDFLRQLTTFRAQAASAPAACLALIAFGRLFLGHLAAIYLGRQRRDPGAAGRRPARLAS
jgi:hypothetical protein